jgi:hypothetical protein
MLFDIPSLRFLRRFRFFDATARAFALWLSRWLSAPASGLRQVQPQVNEAEFPTASQRACLNGLWMIGALRTVHRSMRSAD